VKHLLIILSIFLLTSPLFGQESGILYPWETTSGNVWKTFGDVHFQPQYKGEISNDKPNGVGILYNGNPNWFHKDGGILYSHRSIYIGEWKNGKIHGLGTFTHSDGSKKVGKFSQGQDWNTTWYGEFGSITKKYFKGVVVVEKKYNGILFSQIKGDSTFWNPVSTNSTTGKYEGEIKNGVPNGRGNIILNNGEKYDGEWSEGNKQGQGTHIFSDGGKYVGQWIKGRYHGKGTLTFSDGLIKEGEFRIGTDWNTTWYSNGLIVGNYVNGIRQ
jgi:hypothetical protein